MALMGCREGKCAWLLGPDFFRGGRESLACVRAESITTRALPAGEVRGGVPPESDFETAEPDVSGCVCIRAPRRMSPSPGTMR
jgi:hypothetical protein